MKRVTFTLILLIILFTNLNSVVIMNYYCQTLEPEQCEDNSTTLDSKLSERSIGSLQAQAAAEFLAANASYQKFLEQYELTEINLSNYSDQSITIGETISHISNAERFFIFIYIKSQSFNLNIDIVESLKIFDYELFCDRFHMNHTIMKEVEKYLKRGEVFGVLYRIIEKAGEINIRLTHLKSSIDKNIPDIDAIYDINQRFANTSLFGQYVAMVFREITRQGTQ